MVSEEEKRRLLRERRAAKVKNSTERLSKITGERLGFEKEEIKTATPPSSSSPTPPPIVKPRPTTADTASRRISQTFAHPDPEIQDISTLQSDSIQEDEAKEFQKVLQDYLKSEHHKHEGNGQTASDPTMDLFSQLMGGSIPGSSSGNPLFDSLLQQQQPQQSQQQAKSLEEIEYHQKLVEYNKQENDRFKARFMLFKSLTLVILTLYTFFTEGFHSSTSPLIRYEYVGSTSIFFRTFTTLEVLFTSFYAYRIANLPDNEYSFSFAVILKYLNFVPEQFLPNVWRNRIRLVVKYLDLFQLILFDLAVVFVTFGLLSYLH